MEKKLKQRKHRKAVRTPDIYKEVPDVHEG